MSIHISPNLQEQSSLLSKNVIWPSVLPLSPRECEIIRLVASDLTNKEIAAVLEISCWTVSTHLRRIFTKLDVHSKAAMVAHVLNCVAIAQRNSLIDEVCKLVDHSEKFVGHREVVYKATRSA